jgi:integrase
MPVGKRRAPLPPTKPRNADVRSREYLTPAEATKLRDAAKDLGRHGFRDWVLLMMMMYRHGLRVGEAVDIKWEQVDLQTGKFRRPEFPEQCRSALPSRWDGSVQWTRGFSYKRSVLFEWGDRQCVE